MAITRPRAWFALLSVVLGGHGVQAAPLGIDLLPGERANIVDLQGEAPVRVAVLASAELDVSSIELESLQLAGANIVKDGQGRTHVLEDVNGDGLLDLIVQFAPRQLRLGTGDTMTVLTGRTASGEPLEGHDAVQSLQAVLEAAKPALSTDEKLPPLQVELLTAADSGELAVLGSVDLDPRIVALSSVRVNGASIGKGQEGDVVAYRDVNGDGREDALFWPKAALVGPARFEAATKMGRMLVGGPAPTPGPEEAPAGAPKAMYPGQISLPDTSPASPYPATIQVSGATGVVSRVRVTINGIIHTCFNDLDIMLVAPSGQSVVLMSDMGGCGGVANATYLTFDDNALQTLSPGAVPTTPSTVRVANDGGGDVFAAPAPAPSGATRLAAFNGTEPNGAWKLYIMDDAAGATGVIQRGFSLDLVTMTEVCNPTPLTLPDSGPASAYPSSITVTGLPPQIAKVSVTLNGLNHNNPDDLDVLLVGPSGRQETLMSDAGGVTPAVNLQLTFDDDATGFVVDGDALTSETYHPANHEGTGDPFPAPAPANISHADLREYRGENPNGTWRLYVVDDAAGATGTLTGGWCLRVTSIVPSESCRISSFTIPAGAPGTTLGPADPYPSFMVITGMSGLVRSAEVRLLGLSHTYPDDLDIVLKGPSGRKISLLSDAGGSGDVNNLDVAINDAAAFPVPDEGPLGPGPYAASDYEGADPLPAGGPSPPYSFAAFNEPPNGEWTLWINDDAGADTGVLAGGYCMSLTLYEPGQEYCSDVISTLTIPSGAPGTTSGPATPYPWQLRVPDDGKIVRKLRLRLEGLTHSFPDDLDLLLVGPRGQASLIMSDAGGGTDAVNQTITFDDEVAPIPDLGPFVSGGVYRPQNYEAGSDPFPAPAPAGPYASDLFTFHGTEASGYWSLYVVDDAGQDVGSIQRWCLEVLPLYPAGEATNLRWADRTVLQWDGAPNASTYFVLRGTEAELGNLLAATPEGCLNAGFGSREQVAVGFTSEPPPGAFFWYLVLPRSGASSYFPTGNARIAGAETARVADPAGVCAVP